MPRRRYMNWNPRGETLAVVRQAIDICNAYQAQGFDLTLRQLYYQFVARDLIPNNEKSYKRLGNIVADARLAGFLDWEHIVDRTRNLEEESHWNNPAHIIRAVASQYREDKWAEQDTYVEVWIEKDALKGVLESVCPDEDVPYFSCRGYTSASEIWGAAQRLGEKIGKGKNVVIIHLGDHDPSGIDMSRDIEDRLRMFIAQDAGLVGYDEYDSADDLKWAYEEATEDFLTIDRIALNHDQVLAYNPPPNPAKLTDARADEYVRRFGPNSWELDALDPATLVNLIRTSIESYKDADVWQEAVDHEASQRETLRLVHENWDEVVEGLGVEMNDGDHDEDDDDQAD